ncbi:putative brain/reproductive organ-expressed protein [Rosa chinensis]|uniref:BRISC and BRCA1-A complex member 2 n=1 Tax=Rosa chinensis TaxID=74649 RepID=A0A2P6QS79_ROSCH|nr:putative brain/reproductive organ-expressed protein [Rosa chinensis]
MVRKVLCLDFIKCDFIKVLDRFTLAISYCLDFIKWDVIFDAEYPMSAPDIIFGPEDESFQQFLVLHGEDPKSPMNRLGGWDSRDPTQLMLLVQELRDQYMAYRMKRVGEVQDDRVKFEISTIAFREVMFQFNIVCLADCENFKFIYRVRGDALRSLLL